MAGKKIDGKLVRKFFFARKTFDGRSVFVAVEAFDKDHAVRRMIERWKFTEKRDWEFLEELDPEHFVGVLGTDLPMPVIGSNLH